MRAVTFDVSVPRYLLARTVGRMSDRVRYGRPVGVALREVEPPPLPGSRWVRLEVLEAGICGTDVATVGYAASPALEPFGSFPAVLGHEILARVTETGSDVRRVGVGDRVVVDPMVSCEVRGFEASEWCGSCRAGRHSTCERAGEEGAIDVAGEPIAPGVTQGFHRSLPGGWAEGTIAHETQLFTVPEPVDPHAAVLIEPLAVGMHAVLNTVHPPEGPVLVIGSGPIALGTIWSLRASGFQGEVVSQAKRPHEARLARLLGANDVVAPGREAREALIDTGARAYMPIIGDEVYAGGGFPVIYDCVGSTDSIGQSLRYAAPRGRVVMLGCAARSRGLDLTFLWARELQVHGFVGYGRERVDGMDQHTFDIVARLLAGTDAPVEQMVTHVFPLSQYREALRAAANRRDTGSVKVLLDPRA